GSVMSVTSRCRAPSATTRHTPPILLERRIRPRPTNHRWLRMKILLVDNHDSYTHNLYQMFAANSGVTVDVLLNDDPSWRDLDVSRYDAAVISPGPGAPNCERDFGCAA